MVGIIDLASFEAVFSLGLSSVLRMLGVLFFLFLGIFEIVIVM